MKKIITSSDMLPLRSGSNNLLLSPKKTIDKSSDYFSETSLFRIRAAPEKQKARLLANLSPENPQARKGSTGNGDDEYQFQSLLPGTEVTQWDSTDDIVPAGFSSYSNATDWNRLPPSNTIRRLRNARESTEHGLMSLSMPLPLMSGKNQNEESQFIAELYVRSLSSMSPAIMLLVAN